MLVNLNGICSKVILQIKDVKGLMIGQPLTTNTVVWTYNPICHFCELSSNPHNWRSCLILARINEARVKADLTPIVWKKGLGDEQPDWEMSNIPAPLDWEVVGRPLV